MNANTVNLITVAISAVVQIIQAHHSAGNPGEPPMTETQALALLRQAVSDSLAKDAQIETRLSAGELGIHAGSTGE